MIYNIDVKFADWITRKYVDWRGDAIGNDKSITDYAKEIGVTQQTLSNWMAGSVPSNQRTISKLAAYFGAAEVYRVLGLADNSNMAEIRAILDASDDDIVIQEILDWAKRHGYRLYRIDPAPGSDNDQNN